MRFGFAHDRSVAKTRKDQKCCSCGKLIPSGSSAVAFSGVIDGEFTSAYYHSDCRAAEIAMNRELGFGGDDWCNVSCAHDLDMAYWLLAEFPEVAARVGIEAMEALGGQGNG